MSPQAYPYVQVAVDVPLGAHQIIPNPEFSRFDYRVARGQRLMPGHVVTVPFGPRTVLGFVLEGIQEPSVDPDSVREVSDLLWEDPLFGEHELAVARWMAAHYLCRPVDALKLFLPPRMEPGKKVFPRPPRRLEATNRWPQDAKELRGAPAQSDIMTTVFRLEYPPTKTELARAAGRSPGAVDALLQRRFLRYTDGGSAHPPVHDSDGFLPGHDLTPAQADALSGVIGSMDAEGGTVLLNGVTGSGKTEVYLRAMVHALRAGGSALLLVPEISLTPQMIDRVTERLNEPVGVFHSDLSPAERSRAWLRMHRGELRVALGPRSAVFAPCPNLSLIVMDEEHETSYKQDVTPRYHARAVALARARETGATVVLGSATPSIESYRRAEAGTFRVFDLPKRVAGTDPPLPRLVDMREERATGNRSVFSHALHDALQLRLNRGEQTVLFLNQRGYSSFIMCPDCGTALRCRSCSVTLTYHRDGRLECHYCGARGAPPQRCPICGGYHLARRGLGTQKVEAAVHAAFPGARVQRMDTDSVQRRGTREQIYRAFVSGDVDVLVGTQMIAKGWDVPAVSLVGIIDADTALHMPDFRGAERTFQLITQVAGRAGRGDVPGEVIVQTWNPDHPALVAARSADLPAFYQREIETRREANYPPFVALSRVIVRGARDDAVCGFAEKVADALRAFGDGDDTVEILGPAAAPLKRIRGEFRRHIFVKMRKETSPGAWLRRALGCMGRKDDDPRVIVDVDPVNMM